jgi:hypothetical protein
MFPIAEATVQLEQKRKMETRNWDQENRNNKRSSYRWKTLLQKGLIEERIRNKVPWKWNARFSAKDLELMVIWYAKIILVKPIQDQVSPQFRI